MRRMLRVDNLVGIMKFLSFWRNFTNKYIKETKLKHWSFKICQNKILNKLKATYWFKSHKRKVASHELERAKLPSDDMTTSDTKLLCPFKDFFAYPNWCCSFFVNCHKIRVLSWEKKNILKIIKRLQNILKDPPQQVHQHFKSIQTLFYLEKMLLQM